MCVNNPVSRKWFYSIRLQIDLGPHSFAMTVVKENNSFQIKIYYPGRIPPRAFNQPIHGIMTIRQFCKKMIIHENPPPPAELI